MVNVKYVCMCKPKQSGINIVIPWSIIKYHLDVHYVRLTAIHTEAADCIYMYLNIHVQPKPQTSSYICIGICGMQEGRRNCYYINV